MGPEKCRPYVCIQASVNRPVNQSKHKPKQRTNQVTRNADALFDGHDEASALARLLHEAIARMPDDLDQPVGWHCS